MVVLIKILQVILALSVLIVLHEFGHFIFAKLFGIRVDKFFLFFDLGGTKLFSSKGKWFTKLFPKAKEAKTEYGIGWLPLGGYCKINGMIDESLDMETMRQEPKPWEFRTKPAWQRLLVLSGGVLFNFLFAILVYIVIMAIWGSSFISNEGNAIYTNELGKEMGFRTGDRILRMDDYVPDNFGMLQADLVRRNVGKVTILRDEDTVDIYIDKSMIGEVLNTPGLFDLAVPFIIDSVMTGSPNAASGIRHGDRIAALDSVATPFVQDSRKYLAKIPGRTVRATVLRGTDTLAMDLQVDTAGRIGVFMQLPGVETRRYSFISAIPAGVKLTFSTIGGYLKDLKLVATPRTEAYKSVGSFIAISQIFPASWDWYRFLQILALLSIMLGVMNLLPIPGLDGGHIVFTVYEMITGRKPGEQFLQVAQIIGMLLLFLLMILAFGNDIGRLVR
ncbi:MAG: RIP metalloprotease RseP [Bacteroidales bacterium]|jgi:regulator of sigma E protease|nr:RIP metalloprotease RseP [Bacteroidota bacterium]NLN99450.1 RIP metalloprotease RseP [Bacteroidales bacterium]